MELGSDGKRWQPGRHVWTAVGTALAVVLGIGGLAAVGAIVLIYVGLSHWGSNK